MVPKVLVTIAPVWRQKYKIFHLSTIIRRKGNKVECLNNIAEEWIDDPEALKRTCGYRFLQTLAY
ncbi:hypothetical protein Scep_021719 [Stephania cephalantha]|uniref:Uncharacterized protein n=1 Tax=Stephania cephalantha TaxID=152367 RepID=A0AAP0F3Y5_9MAGN